MILERQVPVRGEGRGRENYTLPTSGRNSETLLPALHSIPKEEALMRVNDH